MLTARQKALVVEHFVDLARQLHPRDCPRLKRWLRTTKLERYKTEDAALQRAEKDLKPKALDWQAILDFLKELLPILLPLVIKA